MDRPTSPVCRAGVESAPNPLRRGNLPKPNFATSQIGPQAGYARLQRCQLTRTNLVHNGVMRATNKAVRQSVSLPATVAAQVRTMARTRRLSANRMLVELI